MIGTGELGDQERQSHVLRLQGAVHDVLEHVEALIASEELEDPCFWVGQAEMQPDARRIDPDEIFLARVIPRKQFLQQVAHPSPPCGTRPSSRPLRAFDVGQVFDSARHLPGHLASGAEAISESSDEFECEMFFRNHLSLSVDEERISRDYVGFGRIL